MVYRLIILLDKEIVLNTSDYVKTKNKGKGMLGY